MAKEKKHSLLRTAGKVTLVGGTAYLASGYYLFRNIFDVHHSSLYKKEDESLDEALNHSMNELSYEDHFIDAFD